MKTIKAFIKSHPLLRFYALTFAISWGAILIVVGLGPGGFSATPQQFRKAVPYAVPAMVLGPGVAGILLTALIDGRAGLREFRSRLLKWRVGARWYAVALLTAPLLIMGVLRTLSLSSPEFLPRIFIASNKASVVLFGIGWELIGGGILEELGWTGFATPTLLRRMRYGVLGTGLIVGVLWGVFHWPVNGWAGVTLSGALSVAISLPLQLLFFTVAGLTAYRVLMMWVYDRTESLLVAIVMRASLTASMIILTPVVTGVAYLTYNLVLTAALWVVVVVAVANGGHLSRKPPLSRRRAA